MKIKEFLTRNMKIIKMQKLFAIIKKIMKTLEFQMRKTIIMKILEFHQRITKIMKNIKIPQENHDTHDNLINSTQESRK